MTPAAPSHGEVCFLKIIESELHYQFVPDGLFGENSDAKLCLPGD